MQTMKASVVEEAVWQTYLQHGWPMDPYKFAVLFLKQFGVEVKEDRPSD